MSQPEVSEYFIGKVLTSLTKGNNKCTVQDSTSKRKVCCQINFFCPLEVGDSIAIDDYVLIEGNVYLLSSTPIVIIGKDEDTLKNFVFRCFNQKQRAEGFKIYNQMIKDAKQFSKPYLDYINNLCCRWANGNRVTRDQMLRARFKDFDADLVKAFFRNWYKKRILRQFYLFGFTLTEIKTIQQFHSSHKNLVELFSDFIKNPFLFFTVKPEKIENISKKLQIESEDHIQLFFILREIFLQFQNGRNGFPVEEFCRKYPNALKTVEQWLVTFKDHLYFRSIFEKEEEIVSKLKEIQETKSTYSVEKSSIQDLSSDQQEAVIGLLDAPLGIVSGPAGSGKTTILRKIVHTIECSGDKVVIASFTGKAVARLRQVLQRPDPQTLHFLLKNPVDFDALIIDEASMVSSDLFHEVLTSFDHSFKLYLIGDISQLPPIEWGRPFFDLIQTKKIPTYFLTKCHRFYENSGDVNGILENANGMIKDPKWNWMERKNFKILKNSAIIKVVEKVIESKISMFDFTILCPFNKPLQEINQRVSKMFLPEAQETTDTNGRVWRVGDRVINLKNRYDLNIMNGDDGVIASLTEKGLNVVFGNNAPIEFLFSSDQTEDDKDEDVDEDMTHEPVEKGPPTTKFLVQSYALTVHKSQGSEWDFVLLYLPYDARGFITKNLFYTAITRARQCLWIIPENQTVLNKILGIQSEFGRDALTMLYE